MAHQPDGSDVFVGPVAVCERSGVGGGRGVFATADISAGTLLMRERPLVTVPSEQLEGESLHAALARALLCSPQREQLQQEMAVVYPQQLFDVPAHILSIVRQQHVEDVQRIAQSCELQASNLSASSSEAGLCSPHEDDILRVVLCMRFNAFYSGFYVQASMLNHSCLPNALKLAVPWGSDVVAVEDIKAGEEVCMSYLKPEHQGHIRRQKLLQEQHFFDAGPSPLPAVMEALQGCMQEQGQGQTQVQGQEHGDAARAQPPAGSSEVQQQESQCCSSEQLEQLELELDAMEASTQEACTLMDADALGSLLQSTATASLRAEQLLPTRHITRLRARLAERTVRSELARLQGEGSSGGMSGKGCSSSSSKGHAAGPVNTDNLLRLLQLSNDIYTVQMQYRNASNLCHAAILEDMHNVIEYLLANDAKALFAAFPQWGNFSKASKASHHFKQALGKLKKLYSHAPGLM